MATMSSERYPAAPAIELDPLPWRRPRVGGHQPGTPEVGGVPLVVHPGVDPHDVALAKEAVGARCRESEVAMRRPRSLGPGRGHHLPDGVDAVAVGAQVDDCTQEPRRPAVLS